MPRDSLELVDQHAALLKNREKSKKRTRLRSRILDEWKADKVYPQDKPASYNPMSPGRDVLSGGYRRSEYQIEVHSRDYAKRVVSRRENHELKEAGDHQLTKVEKGHTRSGPDGDVLRKTPSSRQKLQKKEGSKIDENCHSKTTNKTNKS